MSDKPPIRRRRNPARLPAKRAAKPKGVKLIGIGDLLSGVKALTHPNYHKLNLAEGRNDRLLHAVLCAYAKHHLDCPDIGWEQLGDILHNAICNEIGDDKYIAWGKRITGDTQ